MLKKATLFLRASLAVAALLTASAIAFAQVPPAPPGVDPTHYWTYHIVDPIPQPSPIIVSDQFFRQPIPLTVDMRERLLNWVMKNNSPVHDTTLHYTWWNIVEKRPIARDAIVTNQFGVSNVHLLNVEFLLTPAWKNPPIPVPSPPYANHYLCYRAVSSGPPPGLFTFEDEWHLTQGFPQQLEFLCTPCLKGHNGVIYPMVDTLTHFAVYRLDAASDHFSPFISDQFQTLPQLVGQLPFEYLFVPSLKKEIVTDTKRSTWSKVKQLYR